MDPEQTCEELRQEFGLKDLRVVDRPDQIGLQFEEHWVLSGNADILRVWYIPARLNRGTIVFSMGSSGEIACYLFLTQILARNGWTVFMYDYRGFGESTGTASLATMHDDLDAVIDWARAVSGRPKVTLMGVSLGTIPSVSAAVKRPDAVNAVILDSPVALSEEIKRFEFLLGGDAASYIEKVDDDLRSEAIISRMYQPALFFVNQADRVTPPESADLLIQRTGGTAQVVRFEGLDHALGPYVETAVYTFNLEIFLSNVWAAAR